VVLGPKPSGTKGALIIWHDVAAAKAAQVRRWYDREHHLERLQIPGFRRVTRGEAVTATAQRFFLLYETEAPEVLRSPAYLARVNDPTSWTRQMMPYFVDNSRTVCGVVAEFGYADGGALATLSVSDGNPAVEALEVMGESLSRLFETGDILRGVLVTPAAGAIGAAPSKEVALRGRPDSSIAASAVLVASTATEADAALRAFERIISPVLAPSLARRGIYATAFALRAGDLKSP
jgi:hypothetical protein